MLMYVCVFIPALYAHNSPDVMLPLKAGFIFTCVECFFNACEFIAYRLSVTDHRSLHAALLRMCTGHTYECPL